jgi:DNA-binding MarR family transcriptional regulator
VATTKRGAAAAAPTQDELTDSVIGASRALVAIAVRSLAAGGDITLVQYRALVVLTYVGEQRIAELAEELAVNSSTVTRLTDRLARKGLIERFTAPDDRRATCVAITDAGRDVVGAVTARRRAEVSRILRKLPVADRRAVVESLDAFTVAAGEAPEQSWTLGWTS